jgi:predicted nucleic acid-binding protein
MKFWDSSALVPLVSREESTVRLQKLLRRDPAMIVWTLSMVEMHSALVRKRRAGAMTAVQLRESRSRLSGLSRAWTEVLSVDRVAVRALRVLDLHDLRAADALQLAAALVACGEEPERLPFVVLDEELAAAAEKEGFLILGQEGSDDRHS